MFAIDLDELSLLQRTLVPFSINQANLYSFREQDYMREHAMPARDGIRAGP